MRVVVKGVLIIMFVWSGLLMIASIGRPRRPIDSTTAAVTVGVQALLIAGILRYL